MLYCKGSYYCEGKKERRKGEEVLKDLRKEEAPYHGLSMGAGRQYGRKGKLSPLFGLA